MIAAVTVQRGGYTATVTGPGVNKHVTVSDGKRSLVVSGPGLSKEVAVNRGAQLSVVYAGSQGPAGPGIAQSAEFVFALPSSQWTINHNFGRRPVVEVFGPGGAGLVGEVLHASLNQVLVYFDGPVTGFAICS